MEWSLKAAYCGEDSKGLSSLFLDFFIILDPRSRLFVNFVPRMLYLFNPAIQFIQIVTGGGAPAGPSAGMIVRNFWPSAEGW